MAQHESARSGVEATRESYAADVDAYRARYGKAEGERRFHAEHRPTDVVTTAAAAR
jgi:hypothetical protein